MMRKDVNLLVFILGCDDEAQAGLQGAGKAKAQGRQAPGARCIEVRGCAPVRRDAANGRSMGAALGRRRTRFAQAWRAGATTAVGRALKSWLFALGSLPARVMLAEDGDG